MNLHGNRPPSDLDSTPTTTRQPHVAPGQGHDTGLTDGVRKMASRTRNRVDGVQNQTPRRRYSNGPCRRRKLTAIKTRSLTDGDTPSISVRQLRPTTPVATLIHYNRTRISTQLLSFTVSQRLSHDGRSLCRSLTYIRTVQLSEVILSKSLTDTSTYCTYTQAVHSTHGQRAKPGHTCARSCDHSCQRHGYTAGWHKLRLTADVTRSQLIDDS